MALVLTNWGALYREMGQWSRAEPLYLRSLQIAEARLGEDSSQVAWHLECLANCYRDMGLYAKAEPLYQRSLRIRKEQLGQDHPTVGECLRELGEFYRTLGQYAKAEPLYQSSLRILEASLGKEHRSVAGSLQGLASLYTDMGQYTGAEPLLQRGLQIYEARLGKDHADVGRVRNTLARLYQRMGRFQDAEAQFKHGLQILEARFGKDHPEVAAAVHNLAELYKDTGRYAEAEPLAQQALDVRRARLGKEHPATVASQQLLATLRLLDGRHAEAVRLTHLALQSQRAHQVRVLPALAESDQLTYLQQAGSLDEPLSLALAGPLTDDTATRTAGWLINGKVVAQQAVAERMLLAREARSEEAKKQLQELTDVRQELARLTLDPTRRDPAEARKRKEELTEKERLLSTQLHQHDERSWRDEPWVELDELTRRLPSGSAYVDFARFRVRDFRAADKSKQWKPARYAAWVTTPRGEVHVVDLGEADVLDAAVRDARQTLDQSPRLITKAGSEVAAEQQAHATLARLADSLLKPLRPYLDAAPRWLICPDGNLWLVPWAALPLDGKTYAVENHTIALVVSGRDLVIDPLRLDLKAGPPLVVADPDFDHRPSATAPAVRLAGLSCRGKIGQRPVIFEFAKEGNLNIYEGDQTRERIGEGSWSLSGRELSMQTRISRFTGQLSAGRVSGEREKRDEDGQIIRDRWEFRLPAETVAQLGQTRGLPSQKLQKVPRLPGTAAEGEAVAEQLRKLFGARPTMLTAQGASTAAVRAVRSPRALVLATHGYFLPDSAAVAKNRNSAHGRLENPLLRCGLLLAGCNHAAEAEEGEDSGVLTGLDVVGLDLRGTELVVLSACETGLGEVRNTEGVAGLRQAFQLAGAQSVLASLWHVPDDDTALLMSSYFSRLASGEGRAEALRQAQLQRIKERRDKFGAAHPYFWAAFSLTGDASPLGVR